MDLELWWLLAFPVFFALGWLAARIDIKHLVRESRAMPRSYFAGLNFLLNEQPDKAIDALLAAAQADPNTIEVHFALGSLFRRRGEIDRAVRTHQSLLARDDLTPEQQLQVTRELGEDYLKAGLLDRAEDAFIALRGTALNAEALARLLAIYQQEKDWEKAIAIAEALPDHENTLWRTEVANFWCELGARALAHSRFDAAREALTRALDVNRQCVRATIILGELEVAQGQDEAALQAWQRVERQDPDYLALVADKLMETYARLGRVDQGVLLLKSWMSQYPSLDLLNAVFQWELDKHGPQAAYALVREELNRNPTVLGLDKLLEAALLKAVPEQRADIELVKGLIHGHTRRVARYRCGDCGFKARQFYWRCPACGGWETYPPRRTEEFDLEP